MARDTKSYEGFRGNIYKDTLGYDTVGYGHKLTAADKKSGLYSGGISEADATALYNTDRAAHDTKFYNSNPQFRDAPENVRSALEDMAYNMGPDFLTKFPKAAGHLAQGNYGQAGDEFLDSNYAKQVGQRAYDNAALIAGVTPGTYTKGEAPALVSTRMANQPDITFPQQQAPIPGTLDMEQAFAAQRAVDMGAMQGLGNVVPQAAISYNTGFGQPGARTAGLGSFTGFGR